MLHKEIFHQAWYAWWTECCEWIGFSSKNMAMISMAISGADLLEVPTIYKAYFSGLCKGISPQNMA